MSTPEHRPQARDEAADGLAPVAGDEDARVDPAVLAALGTEHFVLQSVAGATISESGNRASMYLASLSSGLVAIGFASSSPRTLAVLSFSVLPTVFVLGWLTVARLLDTSVENAVSRQRIEAIRTFYATLGPVAERYFGVESPRGGLLGVRYRVWSIVFTTASMVAVVNAVVGGATAGLVVTIGLDLSLPIGVTVGVGVGAVLVVLAMGYQLRRMSPYLRGSRDPSTAV